MIKRRIVPFRNNKDMAKKRKKNKMPYIIAAAMAALAAASVGLFFYSGGFRARPAAQPQEVRTDISAETVSEDGLIRARAAVEAPLIPTEIENVFVSADPKGVFSFYEYKNGGFAACADAQETDVTVTCSHQDIPARLHYLQRGEQVTGYGLFLTSLYEDDVRLYAYAFLHLTNMPKGYGSDDAMLLVDFDDADFAKADKTYSEVLSFDLKTGKSRRLTSDNGRTVDMMGRLRTDWAQMNDALLKLDGKKLYLSGRNYQLDSTTADIIYNADTSNEKPKWITSGLYENYMYTEDGKLYCVKPRENGFDSYSITADGKETKLASYAGSVEDFLFAGDYMLEKKTLALTRVSTGESKDVGSIVESVPGTPAYFSVSADGTKLVLLCDGADKQGALLCDLAGRTCRRLVQPGLFTNACSQIVWLDANSFLTVAETETAYETLVWTF